MYNGLVTLSTRVEIPVFERIDNNMSASREKQSRQKMVDSGWVDPKLSIEADQKALADAELLEAIKKERDELLADKKLLPKVSPTLPPSHLIELPPSVVITVFAKP